MIGSKPWNPRHNAGYKDTYYLFRVTRLPPKQRDEDKLFTSLLFTTNMKFISLGFGINIFLIIIRTPSRNRKVTTKRQHWHR